jgi:hypothetical protein
LSRYITAACEHSHASGHRFSSAKVARLTVGPWLAALSYARASFECVGLAAPPFSSHVRLRSGPLQAVREEMQEALVRYELYPDRVKSTPIAKAAAEVVANRANNATRDMQEICTKAAQLLNLLPELEDGICVSSNDLETQQLAVDSAKFVFGDDASGEALNITRTLFQARDLILAQQKKDRSIAAYLSTMPPANLGELQVRIAGQQSDLRASNETWLHSKAEKLKGKCEALLKSTEGFRSSLKKLIDKRDELWRQRRSWIAATANIVKTKWYTAWAALKGGMILVRDGRQEAPKRKSVEARYQDLETAKDAIVKARTKLETKSKEMCDMSKLRRLRQRSTCMRYFGIPLKNHCASHNTQQPVSMLTLKLSLRKMMMLPKYYLLLSLLPMMLSLMPRMPMKLLSTPPLFESAKKKRSNKRGDNNEEDEFEISSTSPLITNQIAQAAGGGAYVPPPWLRL